MSIWCIHDAIGFDDGEPACGQVRSYATGWSNHYPTTTGDVEQEASVEIAHIAPWCVPGHRDIDDEWDGEGLVYGDWLRLGVYSQEHDFHGGGKPTGAPLNAHVVMDETAVRALRDQLTSWLNAKKVKATVTGHAPMLVRAISEKGRAEFDRYRGLFSPFAPMRWSWVCRGCHQFAVATDHGTALRSAIDHLTNHCPSTYAHRDQPDHQEDE